MEKIIDLINIILKGLGLGSIAYYSYKHGKIKAELDFIRAFEAKLEEYRAIDKKLQEDPNAVKEINDKYGVKMQ